MSIYVTVSCEKSYTNTDFDNLLKKIGTHYYKLSEPSPNAVCAKLSAEMNRTWRLNRKKRWILSLRVSARQVKSIRRSFQRKNGLDYIRVPYNLLPIFAYIVLIIDIIKDSDEGKNEIERANRSTLKDLYYSFHSTNAVREITARQRTFTASEWARLYGEIYKDLQSPTSLLEKKFNEIDLSKLTAITPANRRK